MASREAEFDNPMATRPAAASTPLPAPPQAHVKGTLHTTEPDLSVTEDEEKRHRRAAQRKVRAARAATEWEHSGIQKLNVTELEREHLIVNAMDHNPFKTVLTLNGTAVLWSLQSFRFWFAISIFVMARAWVAVGVSSEGTSFLSKVAPMDMGKVGIIGSFHSLFLVFFASQSYSRFMSQHKECTAAQGHITDAILLAVNCFKQDARGRAAAHRIFRHLNAVHILAYVGLNPTNYAEKNFLRPFNHIHQLLSSEEYDRIREIGPNGNQGASAAFKEVIGWLLRDIQEEDDAGLTGGTTVALRGKVLALRTSLGALYDYSAQPIPFFYVHLITVISGIYLPLFAYGVAVDVNADMPKNTEFPELYQLMTSSVTAGMSVLAVCLSIIGLQAVGQNLSDPFGDDRVDFPVMSFINETLALTRKLVHRPEPQPLSIQLEADMHDHAYSNMNTKGYRVFRKDMRTTDAAGESIPVKGKDGADQREVLNADAFPMDDDGYWTLEFDTSDRPQKYEECRATFDSTKSMIFPLRGTALIDLDDMTNDLNGQDGKVDGLDGVDITRDGVVDGKDVVEDDDEA